jgi:hypothetical protein
VARDPIYCSVVEAQCEAPAGFRTGGGAVFGGTQSARFKCHVCSEPVCGKCSKLRKRKVIVSNMRYGNVRLINTRSRMVRVCNDCLEREQLDAKRARAKLLHAPDQIA